MRSVQDKQPLPQARGYLETQAHSADPLDVVRGLYQVAIESVGNAMTHLREGDALARSRDVSRAEEAVHELALSLDRSVEAPFVQRLGDLYGYILERIAQGHAQQSEAAFQDARAILVTLEAAWAGVQEKVRGESVSNLAEVTAEQTYEPAEQAPQDASAAYGQVAVSSSSRDWSA
ncbi:MAG TPA: flagellar export chaperone FliS [Bryobacteraceae bacterium]|jgi:flagellar protein FliS